MLQTHSLVLQEGEGRGGAQKKKCMERGSVKTLTWGIQQQLWPTLRY